MPPISIQLTADDYASVALAAAKPSTRILVVLIAASSVVVAASLMAIAMGYLKESLIGVGVWFGAWGGSVVGQRLIISRKAKQVFKQQKALQRPHLVSWDDHGLSMIADDGRGITLWQDLHRYRETTGHFILFLSDVSFIMLPKRSFVESDQLGEFGELVRNRVRRG
jgi:hypothetical protein